MACKREVYIWGACKWEFYIWGSLYTGGLYRRGGEALVNGRFISEAGRWGGGGQISCTSKAIRS